MTFMNGNEGSVAYVLRVEADEFVPVVTNIIAYKDDSALPLDQTYHFTGVWKLENGKVLTERSIKSNRNYTFYPEFNQQSVYDEPLSTDYFDFIPTSYSDSNYAADIKTPNASFDVQNGVKIEIKTGVHLQGKITLPSYSPTGLPVISIGSTFATAPMGTVTWPNGTVGGGDITHIFWYATEDKPCMLRMTTPYSLCASNDGGAVSSKLKYFEFPSSFRYVGPNSFWNCNSLESLELGENTVAIGEIAFNYAFNPNATISLMKIPASVSSLGRYSFVGLECTINTLQFGDEEHASQLQYFNGKDYATEALTEEEAIFYNNSPKISRIVMYVRSQQWADLMTNLLNQNDYVFRDLNYNYNYSISIVE